MRAIWKFWRMLVPNILFTVRYADQGHLVVRDGNFIDNEIITTGTYEPEVWDTISQYLHSNEVLWDIGANIGSVSVCASYDPRIREIHAFEPQPRVVSILYTNININNINNIQIYPIALGDTITKLPLYLSHPRNTGQTSFIPNTLVSIVQVECTTGDILLHSEGLNPPTILKIDVEGWELFVLKGCHQLLTNNPPHTIIFEDRYNYITKMPVSNELIKLLTNYGYRINHIPRKNHTIQANENFVARLSNPPINFYSLIGTKIIKL